MKTKTSTRALSIDSYRKLRDYHQDEMKETFLRLFKENNFQNLMKCAEFEINDSPTNAFLYMNHECPLPESLQYLSRIEGLSEDPSRSLCALLEHVFQSLNINPHPMQALQMLRSGNSLKFCILGEISAKEVQQLNTRLLGRHKKLSQK